MRTIASAAICLFGMGIAGCAANAGAGAPEASTSELATTLDAKEALRCVSESGKTSLTFLRSGESRVALLTMKPAAEVYAISRSFGTLSTSATAWSWAGASPAGSPAALSIDASLAGTWTVGADTTRIACEKMSANDAAAWRVANALLDHAGDIDAVATAVREEMSIPAVKPYAVFAVETARLGDLDLGQTVPMTDGKIASGDSAHEELLSHDDFEWGSMRAAYSLSSGEDYEVWFREVSRDASLSKRVTPAVGPAGVSFIAREGVRALSTLVEATQPSAVVLTVGDLTFLVPDAFPR